MVVPQTQYVTCNNGTRKMFITNEKISENSIQNSQNIKQSNISNPNNGRYLNSSNNYDEQHGNIKNIHYVYEDDEEFDFVQHL